MQIVPESGLFSRNISDTLASLGQITDTLLPDEVYDPNEVITEDSIYQNLLKDYERDVDFKNHTSSKDLWRQAKKKYKKVKKALNKQGETQDFVSKIYVYIKSVYDFIISFKLSTSRL